MKGAVLWARGVDLWLLLGGLVCFLFGFSALVGFAMVSSPADWSFVVRQGIALLLGIGMAFLVARIDTRALAGWSMWMWAGGALALAAVLVVGGVHRGTVGWFNLGFAMVQPVEGAKIALIFALASLLGRRRAPRVPWRLWAGVALSTGTYVLLVLLQPDYGSAGVLLAITVLVAFVAGLPWRWVGGGLAVAALASVWLWQGVLADFQKERLLTFIDAGRDPLGRGYNVAQAKIAIGSGQLMGKGLGFGSQSQLHFLPEAKTDFLFAAIGEEFGFMGVAMLLAAYGVILWRVWRLIGLASDPVASYIAAGSGALLWVQGTIAIGMNMGVMPVTGLPLPFVSYGGSSLLASCVLMGVLQGIAMRSRTAPQASRSQEYLPLYVG
jgi:rod shape determining protein RodA